MNSLLLQHCVLHIIGIIYLLPKRQLPEENTNLHYLSFQVTLREAGSVLDGTVLCPIQEEKNRVHRLEPQ